jgi:hypothetical protein
MSSSLQNALHSDWERMGLAHYTKDDSAFTVIQRIKRGTEVKPCTAPKKRGPKPNKPKAQQAAIALKTPEERAARRSAEILRVNPEHHIAKQADTDKNNRIVGRRNAARSQ